MTACVTDHDGLCILAGIRSVISENVANTCMSLKLLKLHFIKNFCHKAFILHIGKITLIVIHTDTCCLHAAMLHGKQSVIY